MRVAIVEDEPVPRRALRAMVEEAGLECVGEAHSCASAVDLIDREHPDVIFLDIEMPGGSGLDVLRRVERIPMVVFTTAFDQYAVEAFNLEAVDFLLKPFGKRRFRQAVARLRRTATAGEGAVEKDHVLRRLFVLSGNRTIPILVEHVESFQGAGDYVCIRSLGKEYLVDRTLKELEESLDPERFVRIHRSWIINFDFLKEIRRQEGGTLHAVMKHGEEIQVSRRRAKQLRKHLRRT